MNGRKAKALRREVYHKKVGDAVWKLSIHDRDYEYVDPPYRHRSLNKVCIADDQRYLYQTLKKRRG